MAEPLGENLLPLDEVAQSIFNITPRIAQRKAATNTLPIPAFRINGTRRGPLYVVRQDLENWIAQRINGARAQHSKMLSM